MVYTSGLISEEDARAYLGGISRNTFYLYRQEDRGNHVPTYQIGRRIFFKAEDLDRFVEIEQLQTAA